MAATTPYVTGLFPDRDSAERAYQGVVERGYRQEDISLVMSDETRKRHFGDGDARTTELGTKAAEGAGIGAGIGGTVGAIAAAVAAVGTSIALPGLGLVIAGPVAAALAGAGAGGAAGTLVGALVGWNIPEVRVKEYEADIKKGGILMGLRPRSEQDAAALADQWRACKGANVYGSSTSTSSIPSGSTASSTDPTTVSATMPSSTATTANLR